MSRYSSRDGLDRETGPYGVEHDQYGTSRYGRQREEDTQFVGVQPSRYGDDGRFGPGDFSEDHWKRYDQYRHYGGNEGRRFQNHVIESRHAHSQKNRDLLSGPDQMRSNSDYSHWRQQQIDKLDEDYFSWQAERRKKFADEFQKWREGRRKSGIT
jgi:hypothetical protein